MSPPSENPSLDLRIQSLESYIDSLSAGPEAALQRLGDRTDPDAIRRKLAILLNAGRSREAASLATAQGPSDQWCDLAVRALVQAEDQDAARQMIEWARTHASRPIAQRCAVFFAQEQLLRIAQRRPDSNPVIPGQLTDDERHTVQGVVEVLSPVLVAVGQRIENELESRAVQAAFQGYDWIGEQQEAGKLAVVLASRRPLPLVLADAAIKKRILPPDDLAARLRHDHPDSFEAKLLAVAVEGRIQKRFSEAYLAAKELVHLARSNDEQERLAGVIIDIAQNLAEPTVREEAGRLGESLLRSERLVKLLRADRLLRKGAVNAADAILDETRNEADPLWLQLYANRMLQAGDGGAAATLLLKAAQVIPDPDLLRTAAALAYEYHHVDLALIALERVISLHPQDATAYRNLAAIHMDRTDFARAAEQYRKLTCQGLSSNSDRLSWAFCLARAGDLPGSLEVLDPLCGPDGISLLASLLRAEVLTGQGDPVHAFESLRNLRDIFWNEADFVRQYLKLAYMSANEADGHEALVQLQRLQAEGRARESVLKEMHVDEVVADLRERREQHAEFQRQMIKGQVTWLSIDLAFGNAAYWGWRIRTQEVNWIADDPVGRAQFTVYSTNGFRVRAKGGEPRRLHEVECPPKGTPVVIDLSALITLHQLGLLSAAAGYFGKLFVPAAYLANLISEARRLLPHQPSRNRVAQEIKAALDAGRIFTLVDQQAAHLSEYGPEDEASSNLYRIRDVLTVLHELGRVSDPQYEKVLRVSHKPARGGAATQKLQAGQTLIVELLTLQTLAEFDLLGPLLRTFHTAITPSNRGQLESELRAFTAQDEVWQWNKELWTTVRSDQRFIQAVATVPTDLKDRIQNEAALVPFASVFLAREMDAPLLTDDRVCQAVVLNERPTDPYAAFGSDRLLLALNANGTLSADGLADAFLRLLSWRYRFIVLVPSVLATLANRFSQHPPGDLLQQVALYVHDCMRDPGLLAGPEPTEPPISVANFFFMRWTSSIAEFLVDIWADAQWDEEHARALTRWATRELFPSPPKNALAPGPSVAELHAKLAAGRALVRACEIQDPSRANAAVRAIAEGLGMSEQEYLTVVAGAVDGF